MPSLPGEIKLTSKRLILRLGSVTIYEWPASLIGVADEPMCFVTLNQVKSLVVHSGLGLA